MNMKAIQISSEERLRLDSVRGFLCFAAFCYHFYKGPLGALSMTYKEHLKNVFVDGYAGVNVFFMISGFLVLNSFLHLKSKYPDRYVAFFYVKRFFRTVPAWFFSLLIYTFIFVESPKLTEFLWNFFFIFGWTPFQFKQITVAQSWSLYLEELFYLLFPICFSFFKKNHILYWLIAYYVAGGLIKEFVVIPEGFVYFNIITAARFFVIGIIGFLLIDEIKKMKASFFFYISFLALLVASLVSNKYWLAEGYCFFWLYFIFAAPSAFSKRFNQIFSWLGKICYSYYLIHLVFVNKSESLFNSQMMSSLDLNFHLKVLTTFLLGFLGSVVAAYGLYYSVEQPFMRLGQKIIDYMKPQI